MNDTDVLLMRELNVFASLYPLARFASPTRASILIIN